MISGGSLVSVCIYVFRFSIKCIGGWIWGEIVCEFFFFVSEFEVVC